MEAKRTRNHAIREKSIRQNTGATDQKSLLAETKDLLREYDLKAKKSLAQHFLIDRGILNKIVAAAELKSVDTVIEVGPGLGVLTRELAERAGRLVAVELDQHMVEILKLSFGGMSNVIIIHKDVLDATPEGLFGEAGIVFSPESPLRYKVVANLPYYITSAVLRHFLEANLKPELIVVMVQKEVARQIVALPGDMSLLSVSVQFYGTPKIIGTVSRGSFYPAPDVDSAILHVDIHPTPLLPSGEDEGFFDIVHAGFCAARKQIHNAISQGLRIPNEEAISILKEGGIEPSRRAETLSVGEWMHLYETYRDMRKASC
jgi:16S rRNA (adenine1518-N6/adenine1519-N6)-dimethyltransferase